MQAEYPKTLHHGTKSSITVYNPAGEAHARNIGYADQHDSVDHPFLKPEAAPTSYEHQEYPKHITLGDGSQAVVDSADEESKLLSAEPKGVI